MRCSSPDASFLDAGVFYPGENNIRWAVVGGAGVDILPVGFRIGDTSLGLRLEVADHMVLRSPFRGLDNESLGPIHNLRAGSSLIGFSAF